MKQLGTCLPSAGPSTGGFWPLNGRLWSVLLLSRPGTPLPKRREALVWLVELSVDIHSLGWLQVILLRWLSGGIRFMWEKWLKIHESGVVAEMTPTLGQKFAKHQILSHRS